MYVVAIEGQPEQTLDLSGVYRAVAMANPLDSDPMTLDAATVVAQMTCPKDDCLMAPTTRDAMHALVWGAAAGAVTSHRCVDGPAIALTVLAGSEYKPPPPEYGEVKPPERSAGAQRERRYGR
jgi:hypothetical protein